MDYEIEYLTILDSLVEPQQTRKDRTGVGTHSIFGTTLRVYLQRGFPVLTTKKIMYQSVVKELLWFLRGETNIKTLGCGIWDSWAKEDGDLGPIYGKQWRSWLSSDGTTHDQIKNVLYLLRNDPDSRRILFSSWNVGELKKMSLYPCHVLAQFHVQEYEGIQYLDCMVYQRSADIFLGVPFNIASYATLMHIFSKMTGMVPNCLFWVGGDTHLYLDHIPQAKKQLKLKPYKKPTLLEIDDKDWISGDWSTLKPEDFKLVGYRSHGSLKATVAV
ncbi:ThyA Thymidylate synthase [uncultured Caudovirales phage]|uniref:Thymidylate synthase n=1 Tax=uncultured Caudovirales phage TaxID=2100421 RepID=A0A6J5L3P4_9CAUD|nr:ThyA Thymidylate synthase [uncultured Caudovirales phage]